MNRTRLFLLPLMLLAVAAVADPLPSDALFERPALNEQIDAMEAPVEQPLEPKSAVPGLVVGEPAPVFQTLKEAAEAGINPLEHSDEPVIGRDVKITSLGQPKPKSMVPAIIGGVSLLFCGALLLVLMVSSNRHSRAE